VHFHIGAVIKDNETLDLRMSLAPEINLVTAKEAGNVPERREHLGILVALWCFADDLCEETVIHEYSVELWWIEELSPRTADDNFCPGLCDKTIQASDSFAIDLTLQAIALTCRLVLRARGICVSKLTMLLVEPSQVCLTVEHSVDI
jgi:hypothetical protein